LNLDCPLDHAAIGDRYLFIGLGMERQKQETQKPQAKTNLFCIHIYPSVYHEKQAPCHENLIVLLGVDRLTFLFLGREVENNCKNGNGEEESSSHYLTLCLAPFMLP